MKNKYDSAVVFLYATGNENILPKEFRKKIPYTTISTWRKTNYSKYLGNEFREYFDDALATMKLAQENKKLKKMFMAFARSWIILSSVIKPLLRNKKSEMGLKVKTLEAIRLMKDHLGLDSTLKLLGISQTLYQHWSLQTKYHCFDSFMALCSKHHPHQLETKEIIKIKKMLTNPDYDHWPICSIASLAMREKNVVASIYSWYKYAKIFGVQKKLIKKNRKTIGIIATKPNEYLHVDLTYYRLATGEVVCITFVMDNFSRMILGYQVGKRKTWDITVDALKMAVEIILTHPDQDKSFLVADGGSENHNSQVEEFLSNISQRKIIKIQSLKDIRFSNSPVEAVHRTLKGRYLPRQKFQNIESLKKYLEWSVNDYNNLRPHYALKLKTPYEAYFNIPLKFDPKKRVQKAIQKRIKNNLAGKCIQCRCQKTGKCAVRGSQKSKLMEK